MKLGDMNFEDSRNAEMIIIPEIEKITGDPETAEALNGIFNYSGDDLLVSRFDWSRKLTRLLIHRHFECICAIFAALSGVNPDEVKKWKRSEANAQILEMLRDGDLLSFFMSSEALGRAAQSAISQNADLSLQEPQ
ncbi:MAG: hypothetical protein FWD23_17440 [Oscillospiraceae bacterium]|nr:hypothetical protein [Oscillospiraceae bacterium]